MSEVDAVTLEVFRNEVTAIAEEMNAALIKSAHSPNITDREDCSSALFDGDGDLLSQAESIPVHLGAMPRSVATAIETISPESLNAGDVIAVNDPFHGGAHLPDITLIMPIVVDSTIIAYAANRAHHADIGGATPGSVGGESTDIYQEGLRIPPVKLIEGGEPNDAIFELIAANVRTPAERNGDLKAQLAANRTGQRRFKALAESYGIGRVDTLAEAVKTYSQERMESAIASLPNGTIEATDVLDDDGQGNTDLPVSVTLSIGERSIGVDFEGSAAQTDGPVNAPIAVTLSATYFAIRAATDPDIPPNAGCYRPVDVEAPPETIVNARPPAAVVGGNLETSQRIVDVILQAIGQVAPETVCASGQGTMNNLTIGGTDPRDGSEFALYETIGGGFGARNGADGMDGVHVHMSNTKNTPIEVLETAYPLRIREYSLRRDAGGDGQWRGGSGLCRDIEVLTEATVSILADRRSHGPPGLAGGEAGAVGAQFIDGEPVPPKSTHTLEAGTRLRLLTPGGGGYGNK